MTETKDTEVCIILGTRPEIIKLAPVIRVCEQRNINFTLLHTGQHYSEELDSVFFNQLKLPDPDYNLEVGSKAHGQQTGKMLAGIEEILLDEEPDVVLVQGDTNSVLAGAIAVSKLEMELGHIEAGLRSFDREMPEETNRVLADHAADFLFAPTDDAAQLLRDEGIKDGQIFVTGNTVVDAVYQHTEYATEQSDALERLGLASDSFALVTAHRAENVDDPVRFEKMLEGVHRVASAHEIEIIYPIHPRAEKRLEEFDLDVPESIRLIEPQDYLDFLQLEQEAKLILTDSGGIQEEACILGVPCVTLRDNTERPETLAVGANQLAGVSPDSIVECAEQMAATSGDWHNPFGDGDAATNILEEISKPSASDLR